MELDHPKKGLSGCINLSTKITKKPLPGKAYSEMGTSNSFLEIGMLEIAFYFRKTLQIRANRDYGSVARRRIY